MWEYTTSAHGLPMVPFSEANLHGTRTEGMKIIQSQREAQL
jgi:hypothetical protein